MEELEPLVNLIDAEHRHCRWPIGDGMEICGRDRQGKSSYCLFHQRKSMRKAVILDEIPAELQLSVLAAIG